MDFISNQLFFWPLFGGTTMYMGDPLLLWWWARVRLTVRFFNNILHPGAELTQHESHPSLEDKLPHYFSCLLSDDSRRFSGLLSSLSSAHGQKWNQVFFCVWESTEFTRGSWGKPEIALALSLPFTKDFQQNSRLNLLRDRCLANPLILGAPSAFSKVNGWKKTDGQDAC